MFFEIKESIPFFIRRIEKLLNQHAIDVSSFCLDHLCYRVENAESYSEVTTVLKKQGSLLSDALVNGRPISTFKIEGLATFRGQKISVIEIPFPKKKNSYATGFEHAEFVVNLPLEGFVENYPNVNFDVKNITKKVNPEVRLTSNDGAVSIKFHRQSLEKVIELEVKMK